MSKALIVYNSRGGSTQRYMLMLAAATGAKAIPMKECTAAMLREADTVVFASWLMAGTLAGGGFIRRHWAILKEKRTALAVTGLGRTLDKRLWEDYTARAFTREMEEQLRVFYLRGAYDPREANVVVRKVMGMIGDSLMKKPSPTEDDIALARGMREGCDYVRADALAALEAYLA